MPWVRKPMKDVIGCDKLRGGANNHYNRRFPNGETYFLYESAQLSGNLGKWNISVPRGKENNSDSLSSDERNGK